MSFITYAQNFEDVILWRALGHLTSGFYIDVGANDPVEHSVTKAFYDVGWRGINIEPLPMYAAAFAEQRPRDINLAVAAGGAIGELTLYDVPATRGWASPDASVAEAHRAQGHAIAELRVPQRTLDSICMEYVHGDIHFLKIDVEGFEAEVLRGIDLGRWRPWILVIEATVPNSRETNHETWEGMVTAHDYQFAYFDGLNRYYVAREHAELAPVIALQPNVFDAFVPWQLVRAGEGAVAQEAARLADHQAHEQTRSQLEQAQQERQAASAALTDEYAAHGSTRAALKDEYAAHGTTRAALTDEHTAHAATRQALADEYRAHAATRAALQSEYQRHTAAREVFIAAVREQKRLRARFESVEQRCEAQQASLDAQYAVVTQLDTLVKELDALGKEREQVLKSTDAWARELEAQLLGKQQNKYRLMGVSLHAMVRTPRQELRRVARAAARRTVTWLVARESLRRLILPRLARYPALAARISRTVVQVKAVEVAPAPHARRAEVDPRVAHLPASARRVFRDLDNQLSSKRT